MRSDFYLDLIKIHMKKAQQEQQTEKLRRLIQQLTSSEVFAIMRTCSERLR